MWLNILLCNFGLLSTGIFVQPRPFKYCKEKYLKRVLFEIAKCELSFQLFENSFWVKQDQNGVIPQHGISTKNMLVERRRILSVAGARNFLTKPFSGAFCFQCCCFFSLAAVCVWGGGCPLSSVVVPSVLRQCVSGEEAAR